jgi:hypothetical protein
MSTRRMADTWLEALSRLERWAGDVAVCWAEALDRDGVWRLLGITVRGGVRVSDREYRYEHLRLRSRMQPARDTARMLREGRVLRSMGDREFREIAPTESNAYWLTSGSVFGMMAPLPTPSYYFAVGLSTQDIVSQAFLGEPAFGAGQPYYPSGQDALLDVLFGVTRDQGWRDLVNQIVIHLPYFDAFIHNVRYVEGEGMVVSVGEVIAGTAANHELQVLWKISLSERSFQRDAKQLKAAGDVTFAFDVDPAFFAATLQDSLGLLVDVVEHRRPESAASADQPLPLEAVPEAFDYLASAWRNVTRLDLFAVHRVSSSAELGLPVATRSDFSSRLSAFSDVLKAIRVDDSLIDPEAAKGLAEDSSLGRLKLAVQKLLKSPELDSATSALGVLQDIVRVRVAIQHQHAKPDLPTALAKLGIDHPPPSWTDAWEAVRHRAVDALRDLRRALESALT